MNEDVEPALRKVESYVQGFFWFLPNLAIALLVFLVFLAAAWAAKGIVASVARRRNRADLGVLLGSFVRWAIIVFGLLVVATIIFPSVKPADALATLGIGSVAVGFAFKDILQNWLSGLLLLYRQPFQIGDQIKSGDFEGTVERIEARATLIKTYDGQRVVIPNSDIYTVDGFSEGKRAGRHGAYSVPEAAHRIRHRRRLRRRSRQSVPPDPRGRG
jgi:small-conductance mechanosensitive channel